MIAEIRFIILTIFGLAFTANGFAQLDSTWNADPIFKLSGFVDAFYVYDFNEPSGNERQRFLFNHNRHNEFNVNLALLKAELSHDRYRANLSLQAGTYPNDNYSGEDATLKNIFQASVGISLDKASKWWIDAGIMPSHIGFESAISSDNLTLTRSLLAENSPYFLTGGRLTYTAGPKWSYTLWVSNGWQRIQRLSGNSIPGVGTGITYTTQSGATLNWSTYVSSEYPDSTRRYRYFNNLYAKLSMGSRTKIIAGFDIGAQQSAKGSERYDIWLSPIIIAEYTLSSQWRAAIRAEYYQDEENVIITAGQSLGFETAAFSVNIDYRPIPNVACRIEARQLLSEPGQLGDESTITDSDFFLSSSIAVKF